jgi:TonB family protein
MRMMSIVKHARSEHFHSPVNTSAGVRRTFPAVLLLLASIITGLQAQQEDKVYKVGAPGVVSPKLKQSIQPRYTDEAQTQRIMGEVIISFEIDREGKTRKAKVVQGLDPGLDKNALAALSEWLFEPATLDGKPVACTARTQIRFTLQ